MNIQNLVELSSVDEVSLALISSCCNTGSIRDESIWSQELMIFSPLLEQDHYGGQFLHLWTSESFSLSGLKCCFLTTGVFMLLLAFFLYQVFVPGTMFRYWLCSRGRITGDLRVTVVPYRAVTEVGASRESMEIRGCGTGGTGPIRCLYNRKIFPF